MAAGADKTEKATPKRRDEAHKKGQVAKSQDLNGAIVLLAGLLSLSLLAPHVVGVMEQSLRAGLASISDPQRLVTGSGLGALFSATLRSVALGVAPIAGVCLAAGVVELPHRRHGPPEPGESPSDDDDVLHGALYSSPG